MSKILLPHSGYKHLIVYKKSDVIYQGKEWSITT